MSKEGDVDPDFRELGPVGKTGKQMVVLQKEAAAFRQQERRLRTLRKEVQV